MRPRWGAAVQIQVWAADDGTVIFLVESESWVRTWILPILPSVITVAGVGAAAFLSARSVSRQLELQRKQEERKAAESLAEMDARLLDLFVGLMGKAHGRAGSMLADSAVQAAIASNGPLAPKDQKEFKSLVQAGVANQPVGRGEVEAAVAAIAELGCKHPVLRGPALAGLADLETWDEKERPKALPDALKRLRASPQV